MFVFISRRAARTPVTAPPAAVTDDAFADLDIDALLEDDLLGDLEMTDDDLAGEDDAALDAGEAALSAITVDAAPRVTPRPEADAAAPTVAATIVADDLRFTPAEVRAPRGATVTITFQVAEEEVYYGGLSVRSEVFNTGPIAKGASKTVSFTADQGFTFSSYWPTSGVKKADGRVIVE